MDNELPTTGWPDDLRLQGGQRLAHLLESVVTSATDAVLITDCDSIEAADGGPRIVYVNDAFTQMTGYSGEEVVGRTPRLLQCERTDRGQLRRIRTALTGWTAVEVELLNRRSDGREFWVQVSISPALDEYGRCTHWVSIQRDITERRHREHAAKQSLHSARERLRSAFHDAPIGMAVASAAGELVEVNDSLARLLGRTATWLKGRTLFDITHPDDREAALETCRTLTARGGTSRHASRFEHADGHLMDVVVHASLVPDPDGRPEHLIMHVEDVTERNAMERQLVRQALRDDLTGLPNRAMLLDRLGHALDLRERDASSLALLFVDVDGFKDVNDRLGHAAGDDALVALAGRLQRCVRPGDTVARFGGDEFVVLCERTDCAEAETIARRLIAAAADLGSGGPRTTASLGLALADGVNAVIAEELVRNADAAMYEAKRRGRDRYVRFDDAMRLRDGQRRSIELGLRRALERDELCLHYQPQINLDDGTVAGVEALVRWAHPEQGLLLPEAFIPVAEGSGQIVELGSWVAEQACREAARLSDISVVWINVSARQLGPGLVRDLTELLGRCEIPPGRLGLEITESLLMQDLPAARAMLTGLRELGVRLAIDDFGTGYSSLAYLAELPVDTVKVDRSFTSRLEANGPGHSLMAAVLGLAGALGLEVVVEGVETPTQLAILRQLGVRVAQGFHLGRPVPPVDLSRRPARVRPID